MKPIFLAAACAGDSEGRPFDSHHRYTMHLEKDQIPPVRAFWSLTMYNDRQLFAENPINRYAIGDRDDLVFNPDGSLELYIQREYPGEDRESNWLPAPASGHFTMTCGSIGRSPRCSTVPGHRPL